jgi:hypothetical protein
MTCMTKFIKRRHLNVGDNDRHKTYCNRKSSE